MPPLGSMLTGYDCVDKIVSAFFLNYEKLVGQAARGDDQTCKWTPELKLEGLITDIIIIHYIFRITFVSCLKE